LIAQRNCAIVYKKNASLIVRMSEANLVRLCIAMGGILASLKRTGETGNTTQMIPNSLQSGAPDMVHKISL
jgi:hypothetical protein